MWWVSQLEGEIMPITDYQEAKLNALTVAAEDAALALAEWPWASERLRSVRDLVGAVRGRIYIEEETEAKL